VSRAWPSGCLASPKHHPPWLSRPTQTSMILSMPMLHAGCLPSGTRFVKGQSRRPDRPGVGEGEVKICSGWRVAGGVQDSRARARHECGEPSGGWRVGSGAGRTWRDDARWRAVVARPAAHRRHRRETCRAGGGLANHTMLPVVVVARNFTFASTETSVHVLSPALDTIQRLLLHVANASRNVCNVLNRSWAEFGRLGDGRGKAVVQVAGHRR
jgi:hypothetical protein